MISSPGHGLPEGLIGRDVECERLDRLVSEARGGHSGALVLRGEAGVGKSALLAHVAVAAHDCQVAWAVGVDSEMEFAYSGLHQLCGPMLEHLGQLPSPQRDALASVFGLSSSPPPDRFRVGVATLSLFAEVAEHRPLVCVIDDAQWLDQPTDQVLSFVARRLLAERIVLVGAARSGTGDDNLAGLPELMLRGLGDRDARDLLLNNLRGPLDPTVCDRIVAESHGNPLALLELPRTWSYQTEVAGGFAVPSSGPVASKIEQSYSQRILDLPLDTRLLLLAAAAEPLGDPVLLHRAAAGLSLDLAALDPGLAAGLLTLGARVEFEHPLARAAAYRAATPESRRRVHGALADATNPETDSDRRAWHLACASVGPDEAIAVELERAADRALSRGGMLAAAAFRRRASELTPDPVRRSERTLAAVESTVHAGSFDTAHRLLAAAEAGPLDDLQHARVDLLRGQTALMSTMGSDAPGLLLKAARSLEGLDDELARDTYLDAWGAALLAYGSSPETKLIDVSEAVRRLKRPAGPPRPADLLLDGLALSVTDGPAAAAPLLELAASTFADESFSAEGFRWGWMTVVPTYILWDEDKTSAINGGQLRVDRQRGALASLVLDLATAAHLAIRCGDFAVASEAVAEATSLGEATGAVFGDFNTMLLATFQGREDEARALIGTVARTGRISGQGIAVFNAYWMLGVLCNSTGRYAEYVAAAEDPDITYLDEGLAYNTALTSMELLEAAVRSHHPEVARRALADVESATSFARTDSALGVLARSRALLDEGNSAERLYEEAVDRLGRSRLRPELARTHLLFGEWLRRERRRADSRAHLHAALDQFTSIGMAAFADRARRELLATGEKVRKRSQETLLELTEQEKQICRLVLKGFSNREIGEHLFISGRTVEWHLGRIFAKLGITSRRQLGSAFTRVGRS